MANTTANYGNDSIRQLKDEERVRLRPAVIFGSDGLDGCAHAAFEILSNSVDEARQGYGDLITLTAFADGSIQVEDNGRGCPLDWNPSEKRFNWELVFCELYAGGKYNNNQGGDYDFSLGTNGLGSCATQYASEYMDVNVWRDGNKYSLHFKKGKVVGAKKKALQVEPSDENRTGTTIKWRPDLEVFTSIDIPANWYRETMRRQAVVNANVTFRLRLEGPEGFTEEDFCYPKGIEDYVLEKVGADYLTEPFFIQADRRGRDRDDLPDYNVKITACLCFSRTFQMQEYYHNSSWLENGGSPEKAARSALTSALDAYIKSQDKYTKNETAIKWQDVQDCLVLVTNCFSTQTSYENQTKKAINNRFIQQAMTAFLRNVSPRISSRIRKPPAKSSSRCSSTSARVKTPRNAPEHQNQSAAENRHGQPRAEVHRLPIERQRPPRSLYRRGRLGSGRHSHVARCRVPRRHACSRQDSQLLEGRLPAHFQV